MKSKVAPNDPCPCGSGKKFKLCHRGRPIENKPQPELKYPRGLAGIPQYMVAVPRYKDPNDPRNEGSIKGMPGEYKVILTIGKPGIPLTVENRHVPYEQLRGDSYLAIAAPAIHHTTLTKVDRFDIIANTPEGKVVFEGWPNEAGFLARFQCKLKANDFADALFKAQRVIVPAMNNISALLDTPLEIRQTDAIELRSGSRSTRIVTARAEVALAIPPGMNPSDDYKLHASLYREAINSTSLKYQFLCYYKIMESIYARRNSLGKLKRVPELLPPTLADREAWLKAIFAPPWEIDDFILENTFPPEIFGKKVGYVVEHHLQPIRLKITHSVLKSGQLVTAPDDPDEEREVIKWLPLAKCIVRRLLKSEFPIEFLSYLNEDGTIKPQA
jgi:hypothetical protein